MCHPAPCRTCGKITWEGCGLHVAEVRAQVPDDLWCPGHEDGPADAPRRGVAARLFRR